MSAGYRHLGNMNRYLLILVVLVCRCPGLTRVLSAVLEAVAAAVPRPAAAAVAVAAGLCRDYLQSPCKQKKYS